MRAVALHATHQQPLPRRWPTAAGQGKINLATARNRGLMRCAECDPMALDKNTPSPALPRLGLAAARKAQKATQCRLYQGQDVVTPKPHSPLHWGGPMSQYASPSQAGTQQHGRCSHAVQYASMAPQHKLACPSTACSGRQENTAQRQPQRRAQRAARATNFPFPPKILPPQKL
jgi:hypothetical protein